METPTKFLFFVVGLTVAVTNVAAQAPVSEEQLRQLQALAEQGHPKAMAALGMFSCMERSPEQQREGERLLTEAVSTNNPDAQFMMAMVLTTPGLECFEVDEARAVELYLKSAKQGNVSAQFNLSAAYYYGRGVDASSQDAYKWALLAARAGMSDAAAMAEMYKESLTESEREMAVAWANDWEVKR